MAKKILLESEHPYRVIYDEDQLGFRHPDDSGRALGYVQAWHRKDVADFSPYCVVNEYVCACLGRAIGLPIPPFALTHSGERSRPLMFSSLNFNFRRENLPPIQPDRIAACLPLLAAGTVLFDIWIGNPDRHDQNLVVDRVMQPKRLRIFDHDQALFGGGMPLRGAQRLLDFWHKPGLGLSAQGDDFHCIIEHIESPEHFDFWYSRIEAVPAWCIEDAFQAIRTLISAKERRTAIEFLQHRQRTLPGIVDGHREIFSGISSWKLQQRLF